MGRFQLGVSCSMRIFLRETFTDSDFPGGEGLEGMVSSLWSLLHTLLTMVGPSNNEHS